MQYIVLLNIYVKHYNTGNKTIAIFLDFAKPFDTVDHKVLLNILPSFGINDQSFNWFTCYLKYRTQNIVMLNDVRGNELGIKYGVPQWSVSGQILFITL